MPDPLHDLLKQALASQAAGRFAQSLELAQRARALSPDSVDALGVIATAALHLADAATAVEALLALEAQLPRSWQVQRDLGRAWQALGENGEAVASLERALQLSPDNAEIYFYLGLALQARRDTDGALAQFRRAAELQPRSPDAWNNVGTALAKEGQFADAIPFFRKALDLRSSFPQARENLKAALRLAEEAKGRGLSAASAPAAAAVTGTAPVLKPGPARVEPERTQRHLKQAHAFLATGRTADAKQELLRALEIDPNSVDALMMLSGIATTNRAYDEAEILCRQALTLQPTSVPITISLAASLRDCGRRDEAEGLFRAVLEDEPDQVNGLVGLAVTLVFMGRMQEALPLGERAAALEPNNPEALMVLGNLLLANGRLDEAEAPLRGALENGSNNPASLLNLSAMLGHVGRYDEAVDIMERLIASHPDFAAAHSNLATALNALGRYDETIAHVKRAIELDPTMPEYQMSLGMQLLRAGEMLEGWRRYEHRPATRHARYQGRRQWQGESLAGKTLLVACEQGLGDAIQFVRMLPLVRQYAPARVLFESFDALYDLFQQCDGFDEIYPVGSRDLAHVEFDYWTPLLSLPGIMHVEVDTIPASTSYLSPDPGLVERWRERLAKSGSFQVGFAWAGNPGFINDRNRSTRLDYFLQLSKSLPDVQFFSLQKGSEGERFREAPDTDGIIDLGREIDTFGDTAAIMECLDVVITVDTSVAHLAGALARRARG